MSMLCSIGGEAALPDCLSILENGTTVGRFEGTHYNVPDSANAEDNVIEHGSIDMVLSRSGRMVTIVHKGAQSVHFTEFAPSQYKQHVQRLFSYRNLHSYNIRVSERYSEQAGVYSRKKASTWQIISKDSKDEILRDDVGWEIIARDTDGYSLSICPFKLRLRLCWAQLIASGKAPYQKLVRFECVDTVYSVKDGPVMTLIKHLFAHAYQNQFLPIKYNSIVVPFLTAAVGAADEEDNEMSQMDQVAPFISLFGATERGYELSGTSIHELFRLLHKSLAGMDISYLMQAVPSDVIRLGNLLPPIFAGHCPSHIFSSMGTQAPPQLLAWPSDLSIGSFFVAIYEHTVKYYANSDASEPLEVHKDLLFALASRPAPSLLRFPHQNRNHDDTESRLLLERLQGSHRALEALCSVLQKTPVLVEILLNHDPAHNPRHPSSLGKLSSTHLKHDVPRIVCESFEGRDRCKFSVFYQLNPAGCHPPTRRITRLRALFRMEQTILNYDCQTNFFTALLADGQSRSFALQDYEDHITSRSATIPNSNSSLQESKLPIPLAQIEQLLACLRYLQQTNISSSSSLSASRSAYPLTAPSFSTNGNEDDGLEDARRLAHEQYLVRLCHATREVIEVQLNVARIRRGEAPLHRYAQHPVSSQHHSRLYIHHDKEAPPEIRGEASTFAAQVQQSASKGKAGASDDGSSYSSKQQTIDEMQARLSRLQMVRNSMARSSLVLESNREFLARHQRHVQQQSSTSA